MIPEVCSIVAGDINSSRKHCCATIRIFILFTARLLSTIHAERIVTFKLQQWWRERSITLHYMYSAYLVYLANPFESFMLSPTSMAALRTTEMGSVRLSIATPTILKTCTYVHY